MRPVAWHLPKGHSGLKGPHPFYGSLLFVAHLVQLFWGYRDVLLAWVKENWAIHWSNFDPKLRPPNILPMKHFSLILTNVCKIYVKFASKCQYFLFVENWQMKRNMTHLFPIGFKRGPFIYQKGATYPHYLISSEYPPPPGCLYRLLLFLLDTDLCILHDIL